MPIYYVNKNAQNIGDHKVHRDGCLWMPITENKKPLGIFDNCEEAVNEAKKNNPKSTGCAYCCPEFHTS